jgi:hypothetical protein
MIIKKIATWLWTQIRKELTIQQAPAAVKRHYEPTPGRADSKIFRTGMNGFAMILLICAGVALLVF